MSKPKISAPQKGMDVQHLATKMHINQSDHRTFDSGEFFTT